MLHRGHWPGACLSAWEVHISIILFMAKLILCMEHCQPTPSRFLQQIFGQASSSGRGAWGAACA